MLEYLSIELFIGHAFNLIIIVNISNHFATTVYLYYLYRSQLKVPLSKILQKNHY